MATLTTNKVMTHKAKDYCYFYDDDGLATAKVEGIVEVSGGSAGAGGGSIVYTNAAGDFTATPNDGTKTITITGLPFTLEAINLASVVKIDSSGNRESVATTNVTVSGGVITLSGAADDFASTDTVAVTLIGPDKAYDLAQDSQKSLVQNPEWAHYTDVEHVIDESNVAVNNYFVEIVPDITGYRGACIQVHSIDATGFDWTLYATLDTSATVPSAGGTAGVTWIDVTTDVFGGALTGTAIDDLGYIDNQMPLRYMMEYENQNATNTIDCWIRKY